MTNRESFVQTWGMESAVTQRLLNAVPENNITYRPDPKARPAIELTAFVAGHAPLMLMLLETGDIKAGPQAPPKSIKEAAGVFGAVLPRLEKALKNVDEKTWEQKIGNIYGPDGKVFQSAPIGMLVWATLFDLVHHRGQLSTYLRSMGGKVPSIYGPSADDPGKM
jgi:uncharacterized damage-inducible protein DinB